MKVKDRYFILKNGETGIIRNANEKDTEQIIEVVNKTPEETPYLSRVKGEFNPSIDAENQWINDNNNSSNKLFLICEINGKIVGTFNLDIKHKEKLKHRASVGIAILAKYWGMGIGKEFFSEGFRVAKNNNVEQIELNFVEGNTRARGLYEKLGFKITGRKPNAIKMNDRYYDEYMMVIELNNKHF